MLNATEGFYKVQPNHYIQGVCNLTEKNKITLNTEEGTLAPG